MRRRLSHTYFMLKAPQDRWSNLAECHELYCAGHLIEAGIAFFLATGKRRLLEVVCKLADHLGTVFGPERDQLHGYDGHPEIELALTRLYEVTQEQRYLTLANYFVEQRGTEPHFYDIEHEKRRQSCHVKSSGVPWTVKNKAYDSCTVRTATRAKIVGSDSPPAARVKTFSARHAFNEDVRLASGTIRKACSKTPLNSAHTLFCADFAGVMMLLHKIEPVHAGSGLPSQCFRKNIELGTRWPLPSSECGSRVGDGHTDEYRRYDEVM
ncbi:beta-L-arabinofuranosidase domain-containing protein [Bradyrhizobium retamae]|uniref:beta-L-arabinofuranosidase domain-containing protein n=1 Tax=Bradyrhizobium retamae TaxID=1300035 RepID=UPI000B06535A|nr:beta-L-arabinofuranosidase domain-containing protein [Bradyrhizobium retamae]